MILDSATTELKAQLYADGFIESFSLYDVKHQNREEGRRGEMVQFVMFSHLQERTVMDRAIHSCQPVLRMLRQGITINSRTAWRAE